MNKPAPSYAVLLLGAVLLLLAVALTVTVVIPSLTSNNYPKRNSATQFSSNFSVTNPKGQSSSSTTSQSPDSQPAAGQPIAGNQNHDSKDGSKAGQTSPTSKDKFPQDDARRDGRATDQPSKKDGTGAVRDQPHYLNLPSEIPLDQLRIVHRAGKWSTGRPCTRDSRLEEDEYLAFKPLVPDDLAILSQPALSTIRTLDIANLHVLTRERLQVAITAPMPIWRLDLPAQFTGKPEDLALLAGLRALEALTITFDFEFRQSVNLSVLTAIVDLPALTDLALALDSTVVTPTTFGQEASRSKLMALDLTTAPFRDDWLPQAARIKTLQRLFLRGYEGAWSEHGPVASDLRALADLTALTSLSVTPAPSLLLRLDAFPKLDQLIDLHLTALVYCVADIVRCKELQTVSLGHDGPFNWTDSRPGVAIGNRPSTFKLLAELPQLRSLKLVTAWSSEYTDLSPLAALDQLEEITLGGNGLVESAVKQLQNCNHLKKISLEGLWTPTNVLEPLAGFKALEEIRLSKCSKLHAESLTPIICSVPNLKKLFLTACLPTEEITLLKNNLSNKAPSLAIQIE